MRSFEKPHFFGLLGIALLVGAAGTAAPAFSQSADQRDSMLPRRSQDIPPKSVRDMLAKQRLEKQKRDHEDLLKRGEEAILLSQQLQTAFDANNQLSEADLAKLDSLEKVVSRIRKGLGGDDEDDEDAPDRTQGAERNPSSLKEAISDLGDMTLKLVDELKKTTKYTVSVIAIQSSNSVLKLVRFLRFRR